MEKIQNENKEEKNNLLKPKIDVVFHSLFREDNKHLLESLLSAILKKDVKVKTTDKNRYLDINSSNEKLGIMDLRAELEGDEQCLIEIQLQPQKNENERMLYYWANSYARQLERGNEYKELNKTISIVILDHEIKELEGIEKLGIKWQIRDNVDGKRILTDHLEIVIIEIPKAIREYQKNKEERISQWMMFFDNPNKKEVSEIMSNNEEIKEAKEELQKVSGDEKLRRIAELREKAIRDEAAALEYAIEKGQKEGIEEGIKKGYNAGIERGRQEGIEKGIEKGRKEGIEKGIEKEKIAVVKNLIKEKINIEQIIRITNLTKEEIEEYSNM